VGTFSGSSFYGTFDQSGNVYAWNDLDGLAASGRSRGIRGGYWLNTSALAMSSSSDYRGVNSPSDEYSSTGIRLAGSVNSAPVPEIDPAGMGSVLALVVGALGLAERRRLTVA
jgi:hypothetical protein